MKDLPESEGAVTSQLRQRRAVMRTVWLLTAAAMTSYAVFLWTAMHPK